VIARRQSESRRRCDARSEGEALIPAKVAKYVSDISEWFEPENVQADTEMRQASDVCPQMARLAAEVSDNGVSKLEINIRGYICHHLASIVLSVTRKRGI